MKPNFISRNALYGVFLLGIISSACVPSTDNLPSPVPPIPSATSSHPSSPQPSPQPSPSWELELDLSGGFIGYQRVIKLSHLGELDVVDEKAHKQVSVQLVQAEVDKIGQLLASIELSQPVGKPPACADCITYELSIISDSSDFHVILNDLNLNETVFKPLIAELMKLQEDALSQ